MPSADCMSSLYRRRDWQSVGSVAPRLPYRPGKHPVGLGVGGKPLGLGVPTELAPQFHGDVAQVGHRAEAVPDLRGEVAFAAALEAIQEIAVLSPRTGIQVDLVGPDPAVEDL